MLSLNNYNLINLAIILVLRLLRVLNIEIVFDLKVLKVDYTTSVVIVGLCFQSRDWSQITILTHHFTLELRRGLFVLVLKCVHFSYSKVLLRILTKVKNVLPIF